MTNNVDARRRDAHKLKKLIEEDRKKDVFEIISDICKSDKKNDVEWVKEQLMKATPTPKN